MFVQQIFQIKATTAFYLRHDSDKSLNQEFFLDQVIPKIEDSLYTKLNSSTDIRALCHIECVGLGTLRAAGKVCPRHLLGPGRFDLIHFPVFFTIYTLDCHHIWRSLDPTLDSCSAFVNKSHLGTSFFLSCLF